MRPGETILQMAERHVLQGEAHVLRQRDLLDRLRDHDLSTTVAEELLATFESALTTHRTHLAQIHDGSRPATLGPPAGQAPPS